MRLQEADPLPRALSLLLQPRLVERCGARNLDQRPPRSEAQNGQHPQLGLYPADRVGLVEHDEPNGVNHCAEAPQYSPPPSVASYNIGDTRSPRGESLPLPVSDTSRIARILNSGSSWPVSSG